MKANGFTLVEILGVVLILSLIVILAFPSIIENIRKSEAEIDKTSMALINNAVDLYLDDYPDGCYNDDCCIGLNVLAEAGYLKAPYINVKTGEEIVAEDGKHALSGYSVNVKGNEYEFQVGACPVQ